MSFNQMLKEVQDMKSSAMDTSIFSPVYSMDSSPAPLSSPLTDDPLRRQLDQESHDHNYSGEGGTDELDDGQDDEQEHQSIIQERICQGDIASPNGPDLTQLSTRIHLDIPHILDPSEPEAPQGESS